MTTLAVSLPSTESGRAGLGQAIRSEWTKLRSVRSTWISLAVIVVAGIGLSALVSNVEATRWAGLGPVDRAQFDPVRFSQTGEFLSQFVVGVLGALIVTSEYSTGSIRTTLAAMPRRTTVLAAKAVVVGVVVFVVTQITAFISFFVSQAVLTAHGGRALPADSSILTQLRSRVIPVVTLANGGAVRAVILCGVYLTLLTLLALGIGFILRHTAGAISLYVGLLLVIPLVIGILPSSISGSIEKYLPSNLGLAMIVVTTRKTDFAGVLLSPWAATGLLALYAAVVVALAVWVLARRDA
ncbi:MAG TPA: ABC transporter permease [Acidimicrobiales bacterium]|nr:ABC transporter permease [Acidimicrobiales bacterium]